MKCPLRQSRNFVESVSERRLRASKTTTFTERGKVDFGDCIKAACALWVVKPERPDPEEYKGGVCSLKLVAENLGTIGRYAYQFKRELELERIEKKE